MRKSSSLRSVCPGRSSGSWKVSTVWPGVCIGSFPPSLFEIQTGLRQVQASMYAKAGLSLFTDLRAR